MRFAYFDISVVSMAPRPVSRLSAPRPRYPGEPGAALSDLTATLKLCTGATHDVASNRW